MNPREFFSFFVITVIFSIVMFSNANKVFADDEILIASWNLQNFGASRAYNDFNLANMTAILDGSNYIAPGKQYDIIFVQELRSNGTGLVEWCENYLKAMDYKCDKTPEIDEGTNRKEAYGVIYKDHITVKIEEAQNLEPPIPQGKDYDEGQMVRPPMRAKVTINDFEFYVYNNHIKPSDEKPNFETPRELENLERAIYRYHAEPPEDYVIVLGDLNADGHETGVDEDDGSECGTKYLYGGFENNPELFNDSTWVRIFTIKDITNFAKKPCSYDKIIPSDNMREFYVEKGIIDSVPKSILEVLSTYLDESLTELEYGPNDYKAGGKNISDHRLIWAKFIIPSSENTDSDEYESLGIYSSIIAVIGGVIYEIRIRRRR